jgi:hypothetical protein
MSGKIRDYEINSYAFKRKSNTERMKDLELESGVRFIFTAIRLSFTVCRAGLPGAPSRIFL